MKLKIFCRRSLFPSWSGCPGCHTYISVMCNLNDSPSNLVFQSCSWLHSVTDTAQSQKRDANDLRSQRPRIRTRTNTDKSSCAVVVNSCASWRKIETTKMTFRKYWKCQILWKSFGCSVVVCVKAEESKILKDNPRGLWRAKKIKLRYGLQNPTLNLPKDHRRLSINLKKCTHRHKWKSRSHQGPDILITWHKGGVIKLKNVGVRILCLTEMPRSWCKATKLKYFPVVHPPSPQYIHFRQDKVFDTR